MSALCWLHKNNKAHLDIKVTNPSTVIRNKLTTIHFQPENIMVDLSSGNPVVKLVDFGDCVNTGGTEVLPPVCLEFAAPELVLGQPVGSHTDIWAVGVFLYVLLSGVSPFLDDSVEETTANILKCDYCFPDDYFMAVSKEAKDLISRLLVLNTNQRMSMSDCLECVWIKQVWKRRY